MDLARNIFTGGVDRCTKRVLVVEDDPDDFFIVKDILRRDQNHAYELERASSLATAQEALLRNDFDIILLDLGLSDSCGLPTLKSLTSCSKKIPVIVLTGITDEDLGQKAISMGAEDYVPKDIANTTLLSRSIIYAIERHRLITQLQQKAEQDPLTGLLNRSALHTKLTTLIDQGQRQPMSIALAILDLDSFKEINDTHGHHVGDKLLQQVAERISTNLRRSDAAGRFGGDEFMLLLTNYDSQQDLKNLLARKAAQLNAPYFIDHEGQTLRIDMGISIGVKEWEPHMSSDQLFHKADMAMYKSKNSGGKRIVFDPVDLKHQENRNKSNRQ